MAETRPRVAVIGSGAWGTTMAVRLARREPVVLFARSASTAKLLASARTNDHRLPGVGFPRDLIVTADPASVADARELVVFAVPSAHLREVAARIAPYVAASADLLSLVKGLEQGTVARMSEVIASETAGGGRVAALSGPNLAPEIARGLPASAVVASMSAAVLARVQRRVGSRRFRLYGNEDIVGVELAGALKNVVAIAAGAAEGLGFGDNGKASLMTRGLAEMMRLGVAAGANPLTFAGLAGIGDVIATCGSPLSRNHRLGMELARGRSWRELETSLPGVAEGAYTVTAAVELADRLGVEMPIAREVHAALFEGKSVRRCLVSLLARESRDELAGLSPGG